MSLDFKAAVEKTGDSEFCVDHIRDVGDALPKDHEELDRLIADLVEQQQARAFTMVVLAALDAGCDVDAAHLERGFALIDLVPDIITICLKVKGDAGEPLLKAIKNDSRLRGEKKALALYFAARWFRENISGSLPAILTAEARVMARRAVPGMEGMFLLALGELIGDENLDAVLDELAYSAPPEIVELFIEKIDHRQGKPVLDDIPDEPPGGSARGFTVRRAVPKIGRNEACHCGSGKKYKKCCMAKDRKRLNDSSSVAGVTRSEIRKNPEAHLSREMILDAPTSWVVRLDLARVEPELRPLVINRMIIAGYYDSIISYFEETGYDADLDYYIYDAIISAAMERNGEAVRRLHAARGPDAPPMENPGLAAQIYISGGEAGPVLESMEKEALAEVDGNQVDFAFDMLAGPCPALGIFVARGVIAQEEYTFDSGLLLEELLKTRDRLQLDPEDSIESIYEDMILESDGGREPDETHLMKQQRELLQNKNSEIGKLRSEINSLQEILDQREEEIQIAAKGKLVSGGIETRPSDHDAVPPPSDPETEKRLRETRGKYVMLKKNLKIIHNERNELRKELDQAVKSLEAEAGKSEPEKQPVELVASEEKETVSPLQPDDMAVRMPVFPGNFLRTINNCPPRIGKAAMLLIGRMASGERASFLGAKPLQRLDSHYRHRVGKYYRLIFRMESDRIEIIDLVHRRDLKKQVSNLQTRSNR